MRFLLRGLARASLLFCSFLFCAQADSIQSVIDNTHNTQTIPTDNISFTFAKSYILDNPHYLLIPKSVEFVEILSHELYAKSGFSLYVAVIDKIIESSLLDEAPNPIQELTPKELRTLYKQKLTDSLPKPYAVIVFMREDKKIDIISSAPQEYFDEAKVYSEYMVPLLPKEKDEALTPQLISATVLNGYATAADMIAAHFGVGLENNMPIDESGGRDFVRYSMYAMLLVMFGLVGVIYLTRKK